jgi:hypothetical protein
VLHRPQSEIFVKQPAPQPDPRLHYAAVSALFLPISQILLQVFGLRLDNDTAGSLLAPAIATFPNFFADKHHGWPVTSRENLRRQMLVFWRTVMLGVSLATLFTHLVEHATAGKTRLVRGPAVLAAQLLGDGLVWLAASSSWTGDCSSSRATHPSSPMQPLARPRPDPVEPLEPEGHTSPLPASSTRNSSNNQECPVDGTYGIRNLFRAVEHISH